MKNPEITRRTFLKVAIIAPKVLSETLTRHSQEPRQELIDARSWPEWDLPADETLVISFSAVRNHYPETGLRDIHIAWAVQTVAVLGVWESEVHTYRSNTEFLLDDKLFFHEMPSRFFVLNTSNTNPRPQDIIRPYEIRDEFRHYALEPLSQTAGEIEPRHTTLSIRRMPRLNTSNLIVLGEGMATMPNGTRSPQSYINLMTFRFSITNPPPNI